MKKLLIGVVLLLTGCQFLGVPAPKTFNEKWLAAQTADTAVLQTDLALMTTGKISRDDAANIEAQADNIKAGLDIARAIYAEDQKAGQVKLDSVVLALQALQQYLETKKPGLSKEKQ